MKVKDCMCNGITYIHPDCSIEECAKLMCDNHVGCLPVCNNQKEIVGLVTDRDILLRTIGCGKEYKNTPVSSIMTSKVCYCTPDTDVTEAQEIMSKNQVRRLPVIENNQVVGMLTIGDLAASKNVGAQTVGCTLENICGCDKTNAE